MKVSADTEDQDPGGVISAVERLVYRERARLVALVAALWPSALAFNDQAAPEWPVVYVDTPRGQLAWHISPDDLEFFDHVERLPADTDDQRAAWDGHTADVKYARLQALVDDIATMQEVSA